MANRAALAACNLRHFLQHSAKQHCEIMTFKVLTTARAFILNLFFETVRPDPGQIISLRKTDEIVKY